MMSWPKITTGSEQNTHTHTHTHTIGALCSHWLTSSSHLCTLKKQFLILLNKLGLLWYILANDYVQLSAVSYIATLLKCIK